MDTINPTNIRAEASRQNGQLGGVKTTEGKAISRYNAVTHGVLRVMLSDYEKAAYGQVVEELIDQYQPVGFMEQLLVERVAVWYVRLFRSGRAEGEQMRSILSPSELMHIPRKRYEPTVDYRNIDDLGRTFARYDTAFENRIIKLLHELERLQKVRQGLPVADPVAVDVNLGSFGELGQKPVDN